jgi:serine kinase of HPr protein (carbohydrate metabolism regulator)
MTTPPKNHHCTCIQINSLGVMIEGRSGSGKTSLALGLIDAARTRGAKFRFVCDDQAILQVRGDELWASVPNSLAGKVELFGAGIAKIEHAEECCIKLVCELVNQAELERYPTILNCNREGMLLDYVQAPRQHEAQAIRILLQKLSLPF